MTEVLVPFTLVAVLAASNIFWAIVCLKLTNRVMSRSYAEYEQARPKRASKTHMIKEDMTDEVAERHARDMNAIIGVI